MGQGREVQRARDAEGFTSSLFWRDYGSNQQDRGEGTPAHLNREVDPSAAEGSRAMSLPKVILRVRNAGVEAEDKRWKDELAAIAAQNAERKQHQQDYEAGMSRLAAFVREKKLVDNPANAELIADFLQDHNLPFTENTVDQAVLAL
jgi:hypothetical protein